MTQDVLVATPDDIDLAMRLGARHPSLPISDIATAVTRPERVGGLHFFSPVAAMRLVEVVLPPGLDGASGGADRCLGALTRARRDIRHPADPPPRKSA